MPILIDGPDDQTARRLVRTLINDPIPAGGNDSTTVFTDAEIDDFLALEGSVKLAAAQALDVIADDEALTGKVIRDSDGKSTDGAKVADSLRKRAQSLRGQAAGEADDTDFYFGVIDLEGAASRPELTAWPL